MGEQGYMGNLNFAVNLKLLLKIKSLKNLIIFFLHPPLSFSYQFTSMVNLSFYESVNIVKTLGVLIS